VIHISRTVSRSIIPKDNRVGPTAARLPHSKDCVAGSEIMAWLHKMSCDNTMAPGSMDAHIMIDCFDPNFLFDGHIKEPSTKPTARDFFFFQRQIYQMLMPILTKQLPLEERPSSSEKLGEVACEVSLSQSKQSVKSSRRESLKTRQQDSISQLTSRPPPPEAFGSLFAVPATGAVY
jgi:hypothetical protein